MEKESTAISGLIDHCSTSPAQRPLVEVVEASANKGEWAAPAVEKVSVALALSDFSARWRGTQGLHSKDVSAGTIAICEFNQARHFEMRNAANFGIVMMSTESWSRSERRLETRGLRYRHATCSKI